MAGPCIPNIDPLILLGVNPNTGKPMKADCFPLKADCFPLKADIRAQLRVIDQQDHNNRGKWYIPAGIGLTSNLLERIIYYRGQGAFFYLKSVDKFFFLPFALDGQIDVYGRYMSITPVQMGSNLMQKKDEKIKPWIPGLTFKVIHDVVDPEKWRPEMMNECCVIIQDRTPQASSQNILNRATMIDTLLDTMAECIPFLNTALLNSTGVNAMRVPDEDSECNAKIAIAKIKEAALHGEPFIPAIGAIDWQILTSGATGKSEEFLLAMQGLDNYRLSTLGLNSGGLFQKKSHMLEAEQQMNTGNAGLIYQDAITTRQNACDIINSIWGLGIWYEPSEDVTGPTIESQLILPENAQNGVQTPTGAEGGISNDSQEV